MSEYQILIDAWGEQPIADMAVLKAGGVAGVLLRLNDMNGGHHMDEGFFPQCDAAAAAGLLWAPYFVYNPWVSGAANFDWLNAHTPSTKLMAVDIEVRYSAVSPSAYAAQVKDFIYLVRQKWHDLKYTGEWFKQYLSSWPDGDYWWAEYPLSMYPGVSSWTYDQLRAVMDTLTVPFNAGAIPGTLKLWQCSGDRIILPGSGGHPIDVNLFRGSLAELQDLFGETVPEPPPPPTPGGTMTTYTGTVKSTATPYVVVRRESDGAKINQVLPGAAIKGDEVRAVPILQQFRTGNWMHLTSPVAGWAHTDYLTYTADTTTPPPQPTGSPKVTGTTIHFDDGTSVETKVVS